MLSNVAYIGYYLYNGVLVSKEAYEPIVPMDDFLYAYSRLSDRTLDGETNESKPKVDRRYSVGINALLEGVLESDGRPVHAMALMHELGMTQNSPHWTVSEGNTCMTISNRFTSSSGAVPMWK
jgi:hypothetical protein